MNIGILGLGQVGSALKQIIEEKGHKVFVKERKYDGIKNTKVDVLHVCIPFSREFVKYTLETIKSCKPDLVIIDATVAPGTTDKVAKKTKALVCHSPIRGIHPHLYEGIKRFIKYIGPTSDKAGKMAAKYNKNLGIKTYILKNARTSELAKLLDTTYYGWNIVFEKEVYKACQKQGVPFTEVYEHWNNTYNKGYKSFGMSHVQRPVLKHIDGEIGGHCVIPNCQILKKIFPGSVFSLILNLNNKYHK